MRGTTQWDSIPAANAQGSTWLPVALSGNNAAPSYSSGPATGSLSSSILSTLPTGTNYVVLWDWLWDATAGCYKGPGLNQCNTGIWRLQTFSLTQSTSGPAISISPTSLTFPSQQVGTMSTPQTFTVTNVGNATLTLSPNNTVSGDFNFGGIGTCGNITSLAPGASCTYSASFIPTAVGTRTGQEVIFNNAANSPQTIMLNGTGASSSGYSYSQATYAGYVYSQSAYVTGCTSGCANYYITTSGSDSNPCTQPSPCKTINSVDSRLGSSLALGSAGTAIHVASGTYSQAITTNKNGTASARIRYISDTQYGARLVGTNSTQVIWFPHGQYTDIVGFDFDGSLNHGLMSAIVAYAPGNGGQIGSTNLWILRNRMHDLAFSGGFADGAGVLTSGGLTGSPQTFPSLPCNNRIESNLVYHNNGGGGSATSNGNGGMDTCWGDIVQNNIVMDQGGGSCIQVAHASYNVIVTNNTMLNCNRNAISVQAATVGSPGIGHTAFTNNIMANTGGGVRYAVIVLGSACQTTMFWSNNLMYGNGLGNWDASNGCANQLVNTQTGSDSTTFVNYTGTISGDYHLKTGSTAINNGTTACALTGCVPNTDFSGISRPQGSAYDIGAYEQ